MRLKLYFFLAVSLVLQLCSFCKVFAQSAQEVVITEYPAATDAIFKADSGIVYNVDLKNTFNKKQSGTFSYVIKTSHGDLVAKNAMQVTLDAKNTQTIKVEMPPQKTGFYKVNFMLNVTDYDDTVRRVFGIDINHVKSNSPAPVDFKQFWEFSKTQLAAVAPNYKITERPEKAQANYKVYLVEMQSLGNITVRGWLTVPKVKAPTEKLPVYLVFPGYAATLDPIPGIPHFACLAINTRGQGNSKDVINPGREEYITYNIYDKNKYILRGAIMDCKRAVDYIASNKDLDVKSIYATGGSMGAYLSLVLAGLDDRVSLCAADNPTFSDFRWSVGIDAFPMSSIEHFAKAKKLSMSNILNTLDYFDLKNFTPTIRAKTIFGMGLLDNFAPPYTELVAYNSIPAEKRLFIFPALGHEIGTSLGNYKGKWLYDNFHMYDRITALSGKTNSGPVPNDSEDDDIEKYNGNLVGMMLHSGAKSGMFKKKSIIYYDADLKNNGLTLQKGTLSCQVTTREGERISITTAALRITPGAIQKLHMTLPLQKSGYYKADFILDVVGFKDTLHRSFGVDVGKMRPGMQPETISLVERPGAKDALFSSKSTAFYNLELQNNFDSQQTGMVACEVRSMSNRFISLTSLAVKLNPNASTEMRINLPTQKRGQYKANFIITVGRYRDTVKRMFSVDTAGVRSAPFSDDETIAMVEHPGNKEAIFKSTDVIYYDLDLKNNFEVPQNGKISCQILTMDGKELSITSLAVSLAAKATRQVRMNIPKQTAAFYKVNFVINTPDYDDTVRRVFGVDINKINSPYPKPGNFDAFWDSAKNDLGKIEPNFKMIERPELAKGNDQVYLIEMKSIDNLIVRAWLTLPKNRKKNQKFPVYLALPGYGADQKPFHDMPDFAAIALNIRGQGNSNDVLSIGREEFLTYNILDKNKYIMRGAIMDCMRVVDFIYSRVEFDTKGIYANGGSMGGYLALILASLDKRVTLCTAGNPAFGDFRTLVDHNDFPMGAIQRYAVDNGQDLNKILDNLDYFDLKNFVAGIKCKSLIGIGLLDNLAPPNTELAVYNNMKYYKKIFIFPNLGHEVGDNFGNYTGRWVYDSLGLF